MIQAILDEGVPGAIALRLREEGLQVDNFPESWRSLSDDKVIDFALAAGLDWLITCDKRMPFQQNLRGKALSVLVLPTSRIPEIEAISANLRAVLREPVPGNFVRTGQSGFVFGQPSPHFQGI